jgi:hypothetical protein
VFSSRCCDASEAQNEQSGDRKSSFNGIPLPACADPTSWAAWDRHPLMSRSLKRGGTTMRDMKFESARFFFEDIELMRSFVNVKALPVNWENIDARIEIALIDQTRPEFVTEILLPNTSSNSDLNANQDMLKIPLADLTNGADGEHSEDDLSDCFTIRHATLLLEKQKANEQDWREPYKFDASPKNLRSRSVSNMIDTKSSLEEEAEVQSDEIPAREPPRLPDESVLKRFLSIQLDGLYGNEITRNLFFSEKTYKLTILVWATGEVEPTDAIEHTSFLVPVLQYCATDGNFMSLVGVLWPRAALSKEQSEKDILTDVELPGHINSNQWCIWTQHPFLNEKYDGWKLRDIRYGDASPFTSVTSAISSKVKKYTRNSKRTVSSFYTIEFLRSKYPAPGEETFVVEIRNPINDEPTRLSIPWNAIFKYTTQEVFFDTAREILKLCRTDQFLKAYSIVERDNNASNSISKMDSIFNSLGNHTLRRSEDGGAESPRNSRASQPLKS